jgi:hypothetical protein
MTSDKLIDLQDKRRDQEGKIRMQQVRMLHQLRRIIIETMDASGYMIMEAGLDPDPQPVDEDGMPVLSPTLRWALVNCALNAVVTTAAEERCMSKEELLEIVAQAYQDNVLEEDERADEALQ